MAANQTYFSGRISSTRSGPEERKEIHHYQVYRGMSPTSTNRLEIRIKELEETVEEERDGRMRAEKELSEISANFDELAERLEAADDLSSAQSEISRRREMEIQKLKKDLETMAVQHESQEASLRKKHQDGLNEVMQQMEHLKQNKNKSDKDKQQLNIELDTLSNLLDVTTKAKAAAESKLAAVDDQLRRFQLQGEDSMRQITEFNSLKARLTQENCELHRHVQDLDQVNAALTKSKTSLQQELEEAKSALEEETAARNQLAIQVTNLQVDFDNVSSQLDEESNAAANLRTQLQRIQVEQQQLKGKYENDLTNVSMELEDTKRKLLSRIAELEEFVEQGRNRAAKFEKERNKMQIEIRDVTIECDKANAHFQEAKDRLKLADHAIVELRGRCDEMGLELQGREGDRERFLAENGRLKSGLEDEQKRADLAVREKNQLTEFLRESQAQNKDLVRQVGELQAIRVQLESDQNNLTSELSEVSEALRAAEGRLASSSSTLSQIRTDAERRLKEKDEEIDSIRRTSQKSVEEMQRALETMENKYRSEINRMKKKFETELYECTSQLDTLTSSNGELLRANKALSNRIKELELELDDVRRASEDARQASIILEKKRLEMQAELEQVRSARENSERARKNAEAELNECGSRVGELSSLVSTLTSERRRLEADMGAMMSDLDETIKGRREAEERADRLQADVNRSMDDARQEQEHFRHADGQRRQLEAELRELAVRLEQAETHGIKEAKRVVAKLENRCRELETELDGEQRRGRDSANENRKLQKLLQDHKNQLDEERRVVKELTDLQGVYDQKQKSLRKQLEEAEEVVAVTMNKYRKTAKMLEEYELNQAESGGIPNFSSSERYLDRIGGRTTASSRAMSVTRELTRVVRL